MWFPTISVVYTILSQISVGLHGGDKARREVKRDILCFAISWVCKYVFPSVDTPRGGVYDRY